MSNVIRQTHRWLSVAFTVTVIANFVALAGGNPPAWVTYSPLPPLALLMFTGLSCSRGHISPSGAARGPLREPAPGAHPETLKRSL
jgi:hypothetical protein